MADLHAPDRAGFKPLLLLAGAGLLGGGVVWLWANYGLSVYLSQAVAFAWSCF